MAENQDKGAKSSRVRYTKSVKSKAKTGLLDGMMEASSPNYNAS